MIAAPAPPSALPGAPRLRSRHGSAAALRTISSCRVRSGHRRRIVTGFNRAADRRERHVDRDVMKPVEATPELDEFLQRPENAAFLEFYEYWRRTGAGKAMPARADIDPLDIPQLLANVFLMDVVRGPPQRF